MATPRQLDGTRNSHGEEGYILIAVLFLVALVLIGLAVAAPRMAQSIQRDKEIELVHRGEQYKRAIKLYYRKFGTYPTSTDQLLNTNNIRFLRKRYTDPITGKDDWRLIHLGQAKVPPMGFFGQPLSGIPGAANIGTPVNASIGEAVSAASPFGTSPAASPFGSVTVNTPEATSYSDGSDSGATGEDASSHPSVTITGSAPSPPGLTSAPGSPGAPGSTSSGFGSPTSPIGSVGPIVGVGIPSTKASLLDYKKQTHYNQWEFVYNPIEDQMQQAGMMGAGNGSVNGTSNTTTTSPFGSGTTNSSPFSNSSSLFGSGSSNSTGTTTSPMGSNPQQ